MLILYQRFGSQYNKQYFFLPFSKYKKWLHTYWTLCILPFPQAYLGMRVSECSYPLRVVDNIPAQKVGPGWIGEK